MNHQFAKEVGYPRFILKKLLWKLGLRSKELQLMGGTPFPLPNDSLFAADVFVTGGIVDWGAECILLRFLKENGQDGQLWDVGANIGFYGYFVSSFVKKVLYFEPDERNHARLEEAVRRLPNAELLKIAVSDRDEMVDLNPGEASDISHIVQGGEGSVTARSIDSLSKERGEAPLAVKVDIEGFDVLALEGAKETVKENHSLFFIEFNLEDGKPNSWERLDTFCREGNCLAYAVHRTAQGKGYHYQFTEVQPLDLDRLALKMIFVVPPKWQTWFSEFAAQHPSWDHYNETRKFVS